MHEIVLRRTIPWQQIGSLIPAPFRLIMAELVAHMTPAEALGAKSSDAEELRGSGSPGRSSALRPRRDAGAVDFQDLFVPHLDAAYNLARFLSRDSDVAQDIVQEAYLRAFRAFDNYRGGEPRAWILAIVRNCYRAWAGQRQNERARFAEPMPQDDLRWGLGAVILEEIADTVHETPEAELERQSEIEAVRYVIESLPEPFREVLILRELEELGYRQIADIIEAPIGTVMSRLARARRLFGAAWLRQAGESEKTK